MVAPTFAFVTKIFKSIKFLYGAADADRSEITTDSYIAQIMAVDGAAADFDDNTDSLEALSIQVNLPTVEGTTTAGTIIQDSAMGTGAPDVVTVTSSASANTFGPWAEIDASTSADVWISHITLREAAGSTQTLVLEVGTGAGASEVAKIRFSLVLVPASTVVFPLSHTMKVASGTRIAAQVSNTAASADDVIVGISYETGLEGG